MVFLISRSESDLQISKLKKNIIQIKPNRLKFHLIAINKNSYSCLLINNKRLKTKKS